ncbi:hypothetical protein B0H14DRAFT_2647623 [Mycena olivaceomarginata]|nr:hypothetical protein B0H14DRAFT_2647623 [Mycena olivaceomarginata]
MPPDSSALIKLLKSAVSPSGAVPREELPEKEIQGRKRHKWLAGAENKNKFYDVFGWERTNAFKVAHTRPKIWKSLTTHASATALDHVSIIEKALARGKAATPASKTSAEGTCSIV